MRTMSQSFRKWKIVETDIANRITYDRIMDAESSTMILNSQAIEDHNNAVEMIATLKEIIIKLKEEKDHVIDTIYSYYDTANVLFDLKLPQDYEEWMRIKDKTLEACPLCNGKVTITIERDYAFKCTACHALFKWQSPNGWEYALPLEVDERSEFIEHSLEMASDVLKEREGIDPEQEPRHD